MSAPKKAATAHLHSELIFLCTDIATAHNGCSHGSSSDAKNEEDREFESHARVPCLPWTVVWLESSFARCVQGRAFFSYMTLET